MIFIVGVPRSGTTLLRLMVDSHPRITILPETFFLIDIFNANQGDCCSAAQLSKLISSCRRWPDFGMDKTALDSRIRSLDPFSMARGVNEFYRYYAEIHQKPIWGDKTPEYGLYISAIAQLFPEARFIHLVRDGRDVYLSVKDTWFGGQYTPHSHALMWKKFVSSVSNQGSKISHFTEVRYEDIVTDTENSLREICRFVEMDFDDQMLEYYKRSPDRMRELVDVKNERGLWLRRAGRLRIHSRVYFPPMESRVCRWKLEMKPDECREYVNVAGSVLQEYSYDG